MSDSVIKDEINLLFHNFNIEKIIYVDDCNDEDITVEKIIASSKRNMIFENCFPELLIGDIDIENSNLRRKWEYVSNEMKKQIIRLMLSETDKSTIPEFLKFIPPELIILKTPIQWVQEKEILLENYGNTLFLFDQELGINELKDDGITIIKEISRDKKIICCLFTQIEQAYNFLEYRDKLSEDYDIPKDNFFVIPKRELSRDPSLFVYLLKLTILCRYFILFKSHVNGIINSTVKLAEEKVEKIGIEDFDHIIFKIPLKEGAWEPDMFYRIYSGFQRNEYNLRIVANEEIKSTISKIRSVSNIMPKKLDSFLMTSNAWNIQRGELYEDNEFINGNHLPLEVGDIFENTTNNEKYILLTRPCDLMIRASGIRARNSNRFALIRMEQRKRNKKEMYEHELWFYDNLKDKEWVINYKNIFFVDDYILDLCVYNNNGVSKFLSNYEPDNNMRPSLINRYTLLKGQVSNELEKCKAILVEVKDSDKKNFSRMQKRIYETIFSNGLFQAQYDQQTQNIFSFTFNCKRTERLLYERAAGLLSEFYSIMQRPGYPRDYGEED